MKKTIIIAEAGVNHNGDVSLARELIAIAADAGVDYVKFQTWITEDTIAFDAPKVEYQIDNDGTSTQYEMAKRLELSFGDFEKLKNYCDQKKIGFLSSAEEIKSLDFLVDKLNMPLIKIGSGELTNTLFLRKVAAKNRPVILSSGMATMDEIKAAFQTLKEYGARTVHILHCTTSYPAAFEAVNLKAMLAIKNEIRVPIGFSDHTLGTEASIAAVALGAEIIEKHFTVDKNLPGPDHKASLSPEELKQLVTQIRNVEKSLSGSGQKIPTPDELTIRQNIRKGIYLAQDVKQGTIMTEEFIHFKKPIKGFDALEIDLVIGKKTKKKLKAGSPLKKNDI
nr:N-acetylneuraminate synthase [uncultured Desulfobacter sp.]